MTDNASVSEYVDDWGQPAPAEDDNQEGSRDDPSDPVGLDYSDHDGSQDGNSGDVPPPTNTSDPENQFEETPAGGIRPEGDWPSHDMPSRFALAENQRKFVCLPSRTNHRALDEAVRIVQESIFNWVTKTRNIPHHQHKWDSEYEVRLEKGANEVYGLDPMFNGCSGIAIQDLEPCQRAELSIAAFNLITLRNTWAHPAGYDSDRAFSHVRQCVSSTLRLTSLFDDQRASRKLSLLLEELDDKADESIALIKMYKTCAGLPQPERGWKLHLERTFQLVLEKQSSRDTWEQIDPDIRRAAMDWGRLYEKPGKKRLISGGPSARRSSARLSARSFAARRSARISARRSSAPRPSTRRTSARRASARRTSA